MVQLDMVLARVSAAEWDGLSVSPKSGDFGYRRSGTRQGSVGPLSKKSKQCRRAAHHDGLCWVKDCDGLIDALRTADSTRILAEPRLATLSGTAAKFMSGGEQPVPQVSGLGGSAGIGFVPFGTIVNFLPVIQADGTIHLEIEVEVSELNPNNGVKLNDSWIAAREVVRVQTTVTAKNGQTLAIVLQEEVARMEVTTKLVLLLTPQIVDATAPSGPSGVD
jgi:Flp pilus assembly secretin CpaC